MDALTVRTTGNSPRHPTATAGQNPGRFLWCQQDNRERIYTMRQWLVMRQVRKRRRQLIEDCNEEIWPLGMAVDDLRLRSYHPEEMGSPFKVYCADWASAVPRCGIKLRANTLADVVAIARHHDCALVVRFFQELDAGRVDYDDYDKFVLNGAWPV